MANLRIHPNREDPECHWQIREDGKKHYAKGLVIHASTIGHRWQIGQPEEDPSYELRCEGVLRWEGDRIAVIDPLPQEN